MRLAAVVEFLNVIFAEKIELGTSTFADLISRGSSRGPWYIYSFI